MILFLLALPLELALNYFENFAISSFPKKVRAYSTIFFIGASGLISIYLIGKYQNSIESLIFKKFKLFNLEETANLPLNTWLSRKLIKSLYGNCYNCNQASLIAINYKLTQKGVFKCDNCQEINKTNFMYSVGLIVIIMSSSVYFKKLFSKYILLYVNIEDRFLFLFFFMLSFPIYIFIIRKLKVNSKYKYN